MTFFQWLLRFGKKNWSGFNQPKLRDLGPLSDKKLELLTTNCDLLNLPKSYGGNGWGIPSIYGDILCSTYQSQAHPGSTSVWAEHLGQVGRSWQSSWSQVRGKNTTDVRPPIRQVQCTFLGIRV